MLATGALASLAGVSRRREISFDLLLQRVAGAPIPWVIFILYTDISDYRPRICLQIAQTRTRSLVLDGRCCYDFRHPLRERCRACRMRSLERFESLLRTVVVRIIAGSYISLLVGV
jgi:hypothetical protein